MGAEHTKRYRERRYAEIAEMPKIPCACGCGTMIAPINRALKPAKYARGHNPDGEATRFTKGGVSPMKGRKNPTAVRVHTGKKLSADELERRTATRRINNSGVYQTKRGWKHTDETISKMTAASRARGHEMKGGNNPFYGKRHSPELMAQMVAKRSGDKHPNWRGGASTLPYGIEFTRKFKRILRERDNHTCQSCGVTQETYGRTLEIHHVDHNKLNNDPTNLMTVCHPCNVWYSYHRNEPFVVMGRKPTD